MRPTVLRPAVLLSVGLLAATAFPALAACPTAADLGKGIVVTRETGETETFTLGADGIVTSLIRGPDYEVRARLAQGLYLLDSGPSQEGQPLPGQQMTIDLSGAQPPAPAAGLRWQVEAPGFQQGVEIRITLDYALDQPVGITIGDCALTAIPASVTYSPSNGEAYYEDQAYFPDLGFSLVTGFGFVDNGDSIPPEVPRPVAIAAVP